MAFSPARGMPMERRIQLIEEYLATLDLTGGEGGGAPAQSVDLGTINEHQVSFDPISGHTHDGSGSAQVDYTNLTNRTHAIFGSDHTVAGTAGQVAVVQAGGASAAFEALTVTVSRSGVGSPNGSVTGVAGAYYMNTSDSTIWRCSGGTVWVQVAANGAPVGATYVVGSADATLTSELVLGSAVIMQGAGAPSSPSLAGRLYWDTTNKRLYRDPGSVAWDFLQPRVNDLAISGASSGQILVATGATTYAIEAPGTTFFTTGTVDPSHTAAAGCLYWNSTSMKLFRSSGAGVWVAIATLGLLSCSVAGRTDGELLMATGATTYSMEALTSRVSRSGTGSPNGSVSGLAGAIYLNTTDNTLWRCSGGTTWVGIAQAISGAVSPNGSVTGYAGELYFYTSDNSLWRCSGGTVWTAVSPSGGTGAPVGAQYVVGAADATLTSELVLGSSVIMAGAGAPSSPSLAGRLYWDTTNKRWYRDDGAAWNFLQPQITDLSLSGGTAGKILMSNGATTYSFQDPDVYLVQRGTLAARPAASAVRPGSIYFAYDTNGGITYRSTGAAWEQVGAPCAPTGGSSDISSTYLTPIVSGIGGVRFAGGGPSATAYYSPRSDNGGSNLYWKADDQCISIFSRNNISNATPISNMARVGQAGNNINAAWIPPRSGVITAMSFGLTGDVGGAGVTYSVSVYKNGVSQATLTLTGTAGTDDVASVDGLNITFAANDKIELYDLKTGAVSTVGCQANFFVTWF